MSQTVHLTFNRTFDGVVWRTLVDAQNKRLFLEVRNKQNKHVSFSCVDLEQSRCILEEYQFEEPWWISLQAVAGNIALLTIYNDENNPDKKSLVAFDIVTKAILWWKSDFSFSVLAGQVVIGVDTKFGSKELAIRMLDGSTMQKDFTVSYPEQNFTVTRPFQYHEGTRNFDTVKAFLESGSNISPATTLEYSEHAGLIFVSVFVKADGLANYLFVFDSNGKILLRETLGEHLTGIALDTFFLFSGFLIFVKNKRELVCYKIL